MMQVTRVAGLEQVIKKCGIAESSQRDMAALQAKETVKVASSKQKGYKSHTSPDLEEPTKSTRPARKTK